MFIRNFREHSLWFVLGTLAGCQHAGVAPASATASAPPKRALSAASAAPVPHAETPTTARAATAATDPSPFVEGVRLGYAARLEVAGASAFLSTDKLLLGVHDDGVRIEPELLEGLRQGHSQFPRVFGSMPESGWAVQTSYAERTSRSSLLHWMGSEWVNADGLLQHKNLIAVAPWSAGRTLALLASDYEKQLYFVQLGGTRGAPLPQLPRTARNDYGCVHGIQPAGMTALPSGEVFLTGTRCSVTAATELTTHGVIVESWAPGQVRAKVSVLPGLSEKEAASAEVDSILASSGSDVFVAGGRVPTVPDGQDTKEEAYLAHFDGKAWRAFSAPPIERIEALQRAPNGKLWALHNGELWTTVAGPAESAPWQRVPMPQLASEAGENAISSFWVQDDEQVWATLGSDSFSYLVRTKRGAAPLAAPGDEQIAQLSSAFDPMAPYQCENPTLLLLTLSRQAPRDADAPSLRAALRGHTELEGKAQLIELPFLTRRYLGVRGDMDTLLHAHEILSRANIPGVSPELRCLNSAATRTLAIDFGDVKPDEPPHGGALHGKSPSKRPRATDLAF